MELQIFKKQRELYSKLNEVEKLIKGFPEKNSSYIQSKIFDAHNYSFELFDEFEKAISVTIEDSKHNKFVNHFNDVIQNIDFREKMFSTELSNRLANYHTKTQKEKNKVDVYFDEKNQILSEYINTLNSLIHNLNKYVRTLVPEKTKQSIEENPASKLKTNLRYKALLRYIVNNPVKASEGKIYWHYRDWFNYYEKGETSNGLTKNLIQKNTTNLTIELKSKLKKRAKFNI